MKKVLLSLAVLATAHPLLADDVALFDVRFAGDKAKHQFAIEFYEGEAPNTVANFKKLVSKGFYKDCAFHRAFPGILVQTGDPLSKKKKATTVGTGGPGYTLPAEIRRRHTRGSVASARLPDKVNPQRHSNGSQFYVCLIPQSQLDGQYTVFGNVVLGLDTLEAISNKPTDTNDVPVERITIRKAKIIPREKLPQPQPKALPGAPAKPSIWRRMWPW